MRVLTVLRRLLGVRFAALGLAVTATAHGQPLPPTGVQATDGTFCDRVRVTWNSSAGATQYTVWRNTINNSGSSAQIGSTASTAFNDNTAGVLTTYWYWVKAVGPTGTSNFSAGNDGYRATVPDAPANLRAGDGEFCDRINVSWDAVSGAASYQVYRHTSNNPGSATNLGTVTQPEFSDLAVSQGQTFFYWARAQNACGISGFSNGNEGSTPGPTPAPGNVAASDGTVCDYVRVSWGEVPNASLYTVRRHTSNNPGAAQVVGTTAASPFDDFGPGGGATYWYWVSATGPCGESGLSIPDTGFRPGTPGTVTGVVASNGTNCAHVRITWNSLGGGIGYGVWRNTSNNTGTALQLIVTSLTTYNDTSATPGVTYWYWVRGVNQCFTGPFSTPDTGYRPSQPAVPTGVMAADGESCSRIDVTWNVTPFAGDYSIYRNTVNEPQTATLIAVAPAPPFADDSVGPSETYWYWVAANGTCGATALSAPDMGFTGVCGAGYRAGFEPTVFTGSTVGVPLPGQEQWYNPVGGGEAIAVYSYAGNVLGFPPNPAGSTQFAAGRRAGPGRSARAVRDVSLVGEDRWALAVDFAAHFDGALPAQPDLGNFALNLPQEQRGFRAFLVWDDPQTADSFSLVYNVYDSAGVSRTASPGPAWTGLDPDRWYRAVTTLDYATNRVTAVALIDLGNNNVSVTRAPRDWYMLGGANRAGPRATAVWLAVTGGTTMVSGEGNTVAFDNLSLFNPDFATGFEPSRYTGSPGGVPTIGQDGWLDAGSGAAFSTYTYAGNTPGVRANPAGDQQFAAGVWSVGNATARIYHDVEFHTADRWSASFDIAAHVNGTLPTIEALGHFALAGGGNSRGVRVDFEWDDPFAASWSALVRVSDASNTQTIALPAPAWAGLIPNRWYRIAADFDYPSNRIIRLALTNLATQQTSEVFPSDWYMFGGATGATERANLVRLTVNRGGNVAVSNIAAWDNVSIAGEEACPADCDPAGGFGALDIFDFLCFQNLYAQGDPYACDCDTSSGGGPGQPPVCDIFDFLCFQNAFGAGCP